MMKEPSNFNSQLKEICRKYHVASLYVFGSRAGEIHDFLYGEASSVEVQSDVDVGVTTQKGVSLTVREKVRLGMELEDLFNVNCIDLMVISEVDPFVAVNIIRGERIYCEDKHWADEYDLYVLRRAGDLIHLERDRMALAFCEGDAA